MADSDSSLTPEQRLLKLIEKEGEQAPGTEKIQVKKGPGWKEALSPAVWKAEFASVQERILKEFRTRSRELKLSQINKVLKIALGGMVLYFVLSTIYQFGLLKKDYLQEFDISQKRMAELISPEGDRGAAFFDSLNIRNVFSPLGRKAEQVTPVDAVSVRLLEMTKNLRLTGISVNPDDPAKTFCMIENLEKNTTTFVREEDTLSGMRVAQIKADSVVLKFQDEVIELR